MCSYGFKVLVLTLLVICLQSSYKPGNATNQGEDDSKNQSEIENPENIVFDISEHIDIVGDNAANNLYQHLVYNDLLVSTNMYYRKAPKNFSDVPPNFAKYFEDPLSLFNGFDVPEIGVMFSQNYSSLLPAFLSTDTVNHYPDVLVISGREHCLDYCKGLQNRYRLAHNVTGTDKIQIGYEVNAGLLNCVITNCPTVYCPFDVIVYHEIHSPFTSILSYGLFADKMRKIMSVEGEFIKGLNVQFYIRISTSENIDLSAREKDLYYAFMRDYAQSYYGIDRSAQFIIDTYPTSMSAIPSSETRYNNVYPLIPITYSDAEMNYACNVINRIQIASQNFKSVVLELNKFSPPATCNGSIYSHSGLYDHLPLPNLIFKEQIGVPNLYETFYTLQDNFGDSLAAASYLLPIQIGNVQPYPNLTAQHYFSPLINRMREKTAEQFNTPSPLNNYYSFFDEDRSMIYTVFVHNLISHDEIDEKLHLAWTVTQGLRPEYPQADIVFQLLVRSDLIPDEDFRINIFCSPYIKATAELNEAITTWSVIRNVTLVWQPLLDSRKSSGYWFNIITERELNRTVSDFYVLVRRSGAEKTGRETELPNTFQCVRFTTQLSSMVYTPVRLESNSFSGVTVQINFDQNVKRGKDKIQTMLCFVFGRFTSAEIIGDVDNMLYISDAMTRKLQDALPSNVHWYIELSASNSFERNWKIITGSVFRPYGIHIAGWEGDIDELNAAVNKLVQDNHNLVTNVLAIGITVQNCAHEINSQLANIKSLEFISKVTYIVCDSRKAPATNADKKAMQLYLDTNYYIQQYFNHTMGIDTFFRISFSPASGTMDHKDIEGYLRLLSDINQHSEIYKIRYFMGDAFDSTDSKEWSWWRISDYTDLTNPAFYTEFESEYFGRRTELKYWVIPENDEAVQSSKSLLIGLLVASIILVGALFFLLIRQRLSKKALLNKEEIAAFRNGEEIQRSEQPIGVSYVRINTVKILGFNKKFEIARAGISLETVIGEGQFGIVYRGILNRLREVAVKIPHPHCSKESFQSILAEVKILCYIGNHKNVLSFVGAYTKEIGMGVIYVLTEFCDNGSLEIYLRTLKTNDTSTMVSNTYIGYMAGDALSGMATSRKRHIAINELHRFACEIACGMAYISEKNVVHGDLSTRNVLLTSNMTCKIGDFGLSRKLYERIEYVKKGSEALPWRWMALESLREMQFTTMSDVWSYGVTLWEIFSLGEIPYPGILWTHEFPNLLEGGLRISKPKLASVDIFEKMLECCDISPPKRPTFDELFKYFEIFHS